MSIPSRSAEPLPHGLLDDIFGLLTGVVLASLGIHVLQAAGAVTGGTAGLSLLISHWLDARVDLGWLSSSFQVVFIVVNLPFFALAAAKKGWSFTARSLACVVSVSAMVQVHAQLWSIDSMNPLYGALVGNLIAGVGLLILFRHRASLGGFNILALIAQERLGWRAGYVQMALDVCVVASALLIMSASQVAVSAAGAVVLNVVLAFNHRPGRYVGY